MSQDSDTTSYTSNSEQRKVVDADNKNRLGVSSLVLVAILLAAAFILNATVGNALAITGIKPEFCIAAYCLAILLIRPNLAQSVLIGVLAATVIQATTSIPGLEYVADIPASAVMYLFVSRLFRDEKPIYLPFIATFVTTVVSGMIFATIATTVVLGGALASIVVMLPVVFGTALANAIVVQALYPALRKVRSSRS
jgi:hypothetical protein